MTLNSSLQNITCIVYAKGLPAVSGKLKAHNPAKKYSYFKGTVAIILSDPFCKDDNARFTLVPCMNQTSRLIISKPHFYQLWFLHKSDLRIYTAGNRTKLLE